MGLFSLFYLILSLTIWRQEILSYLILSYLILLFGCKSENKKNCSGQHANTLHLSSGSGGLPPTGLADVGCSPPARRRGTGELGVPLPAAPAAAAALPELPACRPPAGADPPPAAAQRTLSPACARAHRVERERGRRNNHTGRHDCATARVKPPRSTSRPRRSRRGVGTPCSDSVPCQMEERLMWRKVLEGTSVHSPPQAPAHGMA